MTRGNARRRLLVAFERARSRFRDAAPPQVARDVDWPDDVAAVTLLAVAVAGDAAHAVWIGPDVAVLARGLAVAAETRPDSLREKVAREHPEHVARGQPVPNLVLRTIGSKVLDRGPPSSLTVRVEAGDALVVMSHSSYEWPGLSTTDVAFASEAYAAPATFAERITERALEMGDAPYAAAAVLRFDRLDAVP